MDPCLILLEQQFKPLIAALPVDPRFTAWL